MGGEHEVDGLMPDLGYEPVWTYDGPEGRFGFVVDDGCYVNVTSADGLTWHPYPWVTPKCLEAMYEHRIALGAQYRK